MLPEACQALLRAARMGLSKDTPVVEEEKEKGEEDDADTNDHAGFPAKKWSLIPRENEGPEPEYLAKRRKGLPSIYTSATPHARTSGNMRKTKIRKVDSEGNQSVWDVLVPEGQTVDGELVEEEASPTQTQIPAPGTVIEGVGIANADGVVVAGDLAVPANPRRRPLPPKRKFKGPGRGKKKKVAFAGGAGADAPNGATSETAGQVPGTHAASNGLRGGEGGDKDMGGDSTMHDPDQDGDEGSEDGSEDDEGEDGDREDGEISPEPDASGSPPLAPAPPPPAAPLENVQIDSKAGIDPLPTEQVQHTQVPPLDPKPGEDVMELDATPDVMLVDEEGQATTSIGTTTESTVEHGIEVIREVAIEKVNEPITEPEIKSEMAFDAPSAASEHGDTNLEPTLMIDTPMELEELEGEATHLPGLPAPTIESKPPAPQEGTLPSDHPEQLSALPPPTRHPRDPENSTPPPQSEHEPETTQTPPQNLPEPTATQDGSHSPPRQIPESAVEPESISRPHEIVPEPPNVASSMEESLVSTSLPPKPPPLVESIESAAPPFSTPQQPSPIEATVQYPFHAEPIQQPPPPQEPPPHQQPSSHRSPTPSQQPSSKRPSVSTPKAPTPSPPTPIATSFPPMLSPKAPTMSPPTPIRRSMSSSPDLPLSSKHAQPPPFSLGPPQEAEEVGVLPRGVGVDVEAVPRVDSPAFDAEIPHTHNPLDGLAAPESGEEDLLGSLEMSLGERKEG